MTPLCPICRRPSQERTRPFCSPRCSNVDLGRWLTGAYVLPGNTTDDEADSEDAPGRVDPA
jgi:endogenous inhibitor of DNA gyrase (YacG/DUF329 family)